MNFSIIKFFTICILLHLCLMLQSQTVRLSQINGMSIGYTEAPLAQPGDQVTFTAENADGKKYSIYYGQKSYWDGNGQNFPQRLINGYGTISGSQFDIEFTIPNYTNDLLNHGVIICEIGHESEIQMGDINPQWLPSNSPDGNKRLASVAINPFDIKADYDYSNSDFKAFWARQFQNFTNTEDIEIEMYSSIPDFVDNFCNGTITYKYHKLCIPVNEDQSKFVVAYAAIPHSTQGNEVNAPVVNVTDEKFPLIIKAVPYSSNALLQMSSTTSISIISGVPAIYCIVDAHNQDNCDDIIPGSTLPQESNTAIDYRDEETYSYKYSIIAMKRLVDFFSSHPNCLNESANDPMLGVYGESQGGGLSILFSGIDNRVDALAAKVPALCNHAGILETDLDNTNFRKASGFPNYIITMEACNFDDSDMDYCEIEVAKAAYYYDAAVSAGFINVPTYAEVGYVDVITPAATGLSALNAIQSEKQILHEFRGGHSGGAFGYLFNGTGGVLEYFFQKNLLGPIFQNPPQGVDLEHLCEPSLTNPSTYCYINNSPTAEFEIAVPQSINNLTEDLILDVFPATVANLGWEFNILSSTSQGTINYNETDAEISFTEPGRYTVEIIALNNGSAFFPTDLSWEGTADYLSSQTFCTIASTVEIVVFCGEDLGFEISASLASQFPDISNEPILHIINDVTIDQNFIIDNKEVYLDADVEITVAYGARLDITNSTFQGCIFLWQGINVEDGGEIYIEGSTFSGARVAVNMDYPRSGSANFSHFELRENVFEQNVIGFQIHENITEPSQIFEYGKFHSRSLIFGNTFTGDQTELLLPTLEPDDVEFLIPQTGINISYRYSPNYFLVVGNHFENLKNGIDAYGGNYYIFVRNSFSDLGDLNNFSADDGVGIRVSGGLLRQIGLGANSFGGGVPDNFGDINFLATEVLPSDLATSSFNNLNTAIYLTNANFTIEDNKMENVNNGVIAWNAQNLYKFNYISNNNIKANELGIQTNLMFNTTNINSNFISNYQEANKKFIGIQSNAYFPTKAGLNIYNNFVKVSQNTGEDLASSCISINGMYRPQIVYNSLLAENYNNTITDDIEGNPFPDNPIYGIWLSGASGTNLDHNSFRGTDIDTNLNEWLDNPNTIGAYINNSQDFKMTCNNFDQNLFGLYIEGDCISDNGLENNNFDTNSSAIRFGSSGRFGIQGLFSNNNQDVIEPLDNLWNDFDNNNNAYPGGAMFHPSGNTAITQLSEVYVPQNGTLVENPIGFVTPPTLLDFSASNLINDCVLEPPLLPAPEEEVCNARTIGKIISGEINLGNLPKTDKWMTQRHVLKKIDNYEGTINCEIGPFINGLNNQSPTKYEHINKQMKLIQNNLPEEVALKDVNDQLKTWLEENEAAIQSNVDSQGNQTPINQDKFHKIMKARRSLLELRNTHFNLEKEAVLSANNDLQAIKDYESSEKWVNEIYLNLEQADFENPAVKIIDGLFALANACPEEHGESVYKAKSLYMMLTRKPLLEFTKCDTQKGKPRNSDENDPLDKEKVSSIEIFPNPSSNKLEIQSTNVELSSWVLYNSLGQKVGLGTIIDNSTTIDVSNYASGIYQIYLLDHFQNVESQSKVVLMTN